MQRRVIGARRPEVRGFWTLVLDDGSEAEVPGAFMAGLLAREAAEQAAAEAALAGILDPPPEDVTPIVRRPRTATRCSGCDQEGHNAKTCPALGRSPSQAALEYRKRAATRARREA